MRGVCGQIAISLATSAVGVVHLQASAACCMRMVLFFSGEELNPNLILMLTLTLIGPEDPGHGDLVAHSPRTPLSSTALARSVQVNQLRVMDFVFMTPNEYEANPNTNPSPNPNSNLSTRRTRTLLPDLPWYSPDTTSSTQGAL